jgi:hypothetical protein
MRLVVMRCLVLNLAAILASGALLKWYPADQGFTVTTSRATHYISENVALSGVLLCVVDFAIGIYLAWSLWHPR